VKLRRYNMVTFEAPEAGQYDRIVSIEMFEHMKNYDVLFERCTAGPGTERTHRLRHCAPHFAPMRCATAHLTSHPSVAPSLTVHPLVVSEAPPSDAAPRDFPGPGARAG
jgi:hypothetical protein